jgi:hypothetical protein
MSESDTLDFKQEQYPQANATPEQKGEFVKDILAFANAWKTSDAHIIVGVAENPGGRAKVVGVSDHPDDAHLQQLVNGKTNVPVSFAYVPLVIDGLKVGALQISREQQRPVFLRKKFGGVDADVVYLRRGSSTAIANPDEIARMGEARAASLQEPEISIELGDPETRATFGAKTTVTSKVPAEPPPPAPMLTAAEEAMQRGLGPLGQLTSMLDRKTVQEAWLQPDPEKLKAYRQELALLVRLGFLVRNTGAVLVDDLRVVVEIPKLDGLRVLDELPERPRSPAEAHVSIARFALQPQRIVTRVEDAGTHWEVTARIEKVQPNASAWSERFWIGSFLPQKLDLVARAYADNLSRPIAVSLQVEIRVEHAWLGAGEG